MLENVRLAVQATQGGAHRRGLNLWSIWSDHRHLTERAESILRSVALSERREHPRGQPARTATSASWKWPC